MNPRQFIQYSATFFIRRKSNIIIYNGNTHDFFVIFEKHIINLFFSCINRKFCMRRK